MIVYKKKDGWLSVIDFTQIDREKMVLNEDFLDRQGALP